MEPDYTIHAERAMAERVIQIECVERTLSQPALRMPDPDDPLVERFFCAIPEKDNRVLRVAVNTHASPWRVVTTFDRDMRGQI